MEVKIEEGWERALAEEFQKPYFIALAERIRSAYASPSPRIFPPAKDIFAAFNRTPFVRVKVVIIGQDPYHGPGQANGLAFSVNPGIALPPSLKNILTEVHRDTGAAIPADGDLSRWADQGVLLLNSTLTVVEHQPRSHAALGWERFTQAAVDKAAASRDNLVFLLWGADAIRRGAGIDRSRHLVLESAHPSPLSAYRGFFGNRHFSQANRYLSDHGISPIVW